MCAETLLGGIECQLRRVTLILRKQKARRSIDLLALFVSVTCGFSSQRYFLESVSVFQVLL